MVDFYSVLSTEVLTDPLGRGYSGMTNIQVANSLNTVDREVDAETVSSLSIQSAVVATEWAAITDQWKRDLWQCIVTLNTIPIKNANLRAQITQIWGAGTTTRTNLVNLQTKSISRAAELGLNNISSGHIKSAKELLGTSINI